MHVATLILAAQLLLVSCGAIYSSYALEQPTHSDIDYYLDLDNAKGFDKVMMNPDVKYSNVPVFVLKQGTTGTFNIIFTSYEKQLTVYIGAWKYGGIPPWTNGWFTGGPSFRTPNGITYNFTPSNLTLAPSSHGTVTMQITAAPDTTVRSYNLSLSLYVTGINIEETSYPTILTIVNGNTSTITTSITTNTSCTSSSINRTITSTVTSTRTVTVTSTGNSTTTMSTAATPNLPTITSTSATGNALTTFTSTVTEISTERVTEPLVYAWAIGATAVAAVLAIVILRKRV
ncbi:MAG: hypothetical protein M1387_11825 [Thaumarchaeota archaeon]|nr:hypothetical protein [Nitrososphaerota archaeon]